MKHIVVVDPARRVPEFECYNRMVGASPLPLTFHVPQIYGLHSLKEEDPASIAGVVIFGSGSSVNDREAWQVELEKWLEPLLDRGTPTLGLCYGHQMLGYMYGAQVDFAMPDHYKFSGWRRIRVESSEAWSAGSGHVIVSHREHLVSLPQSLKLVAHSEDIAVEGFRHKKHAIFGFQSHPEAVAAFLRNQSVQVEADAQSFAYGNSLVDGFLRHCSPRK